MKDVIFLEYVFIFTPNVGWSHLDQFEKDMAKFFNEKELEAAVIKSPGGYIGRRMLFITKKEVLKTPELPKNLKKSVPVKSQFDKLRGYPSKKKK